MQPTVGCFSWLKGKLWGQLLPYTRLLGDLCLGLFPTPPPWHPVVVCEGGVCTPSSAGKQAVCGRVVHSRQVGTAYSGVRPGWPTPSDTVPASVCWHRALERPMGLVHPRKRCHQRVPCSSPSLPLLRLGSPFLAWDPSLASFSIWGTLSLVAWGTGMIISSPLPTFCLCRGQRVERGEELPSGQDTERKNWRVVCG